MYRRAVYIALALLCLAALVRPVAAQHDEIEITASVDKQTAYIGDLIDYTIQITYDSTISLTPPAVGANLGGFEVKDYHVGEEKKLDDGRRRQSLWFSMRTFTTGEYVIPPLPVEYYTADSTRKIISSDPIKIEIKSVLGEGAASDSLSLMELRGQASLGSSHMWLTITIVGGAVIIVAIIGILLWRKYRKTEPEEFIDPRPPWEIAFADLALLREKDLPGKGELKLFYFELTEIFRVYLGRKFGFEAIDLTTYEVGEVLSEYTIDEDFRRDCMRFLEQADLVKFAKLVPPEEQPADDWQTAYQLVETSRDMVVSRPELEPVAAYVPASGRGGEADDDPLRFAPVELREYFADRQPVVERDDEPDNAQDESPDEAPIDEPPEDDKEAGE